MKQQRHLSGDIPIKSAVIAWQPDCCRRSLGGAASGQVEIFERGDHAELAYAYAEGAGWADWASQPVPQLIVMLNRIMKLMVRTHGIPRKNVEAAFSRIPEYRQWRDKSGRQT